jgi:hypothetical protein
MVFTFDDFPKEAKLFILLSDDLVIKGMSEKCLAINKHSSLDSGNVNDKE